MRSIGEKIQRQFRHGSFESWWRHFVDTSFKQRKRLDYFNGGLGVIGKNLSFRDEPKFSSAWQATVRAHREAKGRPPINVEWRAHVACWAATNALRIEGDFVECGVWLGVLSRTVCEYLEFAKLDRRFWLFDTWEGIPNEGSTPLERASIARANSGFYSDNTYLLAQKMFSAFPNVSLIKGVLPGSLAGAPLGKIAYLSIDLNNAEAEKESIEALWDRLSTGAFVVLDDYAFLGNVAQYDIWNAFAKSNDRLILTLPTGQGLLIR